MLGGIGSSGLVPFVTHGAVFEDGTVVKRLRHWGHDEPRREWQALNLLARFAPGLAPEPVRADLTADPPEVVMSRLPGEPLGTRPAPDVEVDAIAEALSRLHHAIPSPVLDGVDRVGYGGGPQSVSDRMRELAAACRSESLDPLPRQAYTSALAWLDSGGVETCDLATLHPAGRRQRRLDRDPPTNPDRASCPRCL